MARADRHREREPRARRECTAGRAGVLDRPPRRHHRLGAVRRQDRRRHRRHAARGDRVQDQPAPVVPSPRPLPRSRTSSPREKAGEAFAEIIRHLPRDGYGNHGGVAATLVVTVDEKTLRGETDRAGVTEFGTPVSAGTTPDSSPAAPGSCRSVMNGTAQVLDEGRAKRHHTAAQRIALAQRDQGCAFPRLRPATGMDRGPPRDPVVTRRTDQPRDRGAALQPPSPPGPQRRTSPSDSTTTEHPSSASRGIWQRNHRYRPLAA